MTQSLLKKSMEAIWFQDGRLGSEIETLVKEIRNNNDFLKQNKLLDEMELVIFQYTGLKLEIIIDEITQAATVPSLINMNHVFKNDLRKGMYENKSDYLKSIKQFKEESRVSLKDSKVSGSFSNIVCPLILGLNTLIRNTFLTEREVTAIILHEIGHVFTNFELANRFITTNQALALVSKSLMEKDTASERHIVFKEAGKIVCDDDKAFSGLEEITDIKVLTTIFIDTSLRRAGSEVGSVFYDQTTCEYIADQFAARHGYGKELISSLHKFTGTIDKSTIFKQRIFEIIFLLSSLLIVIFGPIALLEIKFLFTTIFISLVVGNRYHANDFTYDELKVRFKRVKEQEILKLKDNINNKEQIKEIISNIEEMESVINKFTDDTESVLMKINLFLSKKSRDYKSAVQLQRDLEELSSNDLFLASAKLKHS